MSKKLSKLGMNDNLLILQCFSFIEWDALFVDTTCMMQKDWTGENAMFIMWHGSKAGQHGV